MNEFDEGGIRIRDFINVTIHSINEKRYVEKVLEDQTHVNQEKELEEGITIIP